ncbi:hypothetical protein MAR_033629 [Mya arenaria]|uniref:Uncharacterized protein n=1 Tax=Mya arenaria TaxID=6604 RepID=A0ABY7G9K1_MYAAR|nr:hypothetical protein MAR_033629 [Mya arenaria]
MDGGKEICIDEQFKPKPPCLIDIEGDEWYSIPQMISSGALDDVKQISMETHYIQLGGQLWGSHPIPEADELYTLRLLYDKGFRIFMRERNLSSMMMWPGFNNSITSVNEISLIKSMK